MNIKKIVSSMLLLLIIVSTMASCAPKSADPNKQPETQGNTDKPKDSQVNLEEVEDFEEVDKVPEKEDINDSKEYNTSIKDLKLEGDYTQLTKTAEADLPSPWADAMFDVGDDVLLVFSEEAIDRTIMDFRSIDVKTGALITSINVELDGQYVHIQDLRENDNYDDKRDILVKTTEGIYFFDLDNLENKPEEFLVSEGIKQQAGTFVIEDHLGTTYGVNDEIFDFYIPDEKAVYVNNEGVFVSNLDGSDSKKIAKQPGKKKWYANNNLAIGTDGKIIAKNTMALYSNPKFIDSGNKVFCMLLNYATNNPYIGFVIIDVETGDVFENNYYEKDSMSGKVTEWQNQDVAFFEPKVISETELAILITSMELGSQSTTRNDIIFDVNTQKIKKEMENRSGLTIDYNTMIANGVMDAENDIVSNEIAIVSMSNGKVKGSGVKFENGSSLTVGLSKKYALTTLYKDKEGEGDKEGFLVLVKLP